jgi:hypothetical protein
MALVPEPVPRLLVSSKALRPNDSQQWLFALEVSVPVGVGLTRP